MNTEKGPSAPHRVVFDVNVEGLEKWQVILNNVDNLKRAFEPEPTDVLVVTHGKGLGLLKRADNALAGRLQQMAETGVVFAACCNTLRRQNLDPDALFPFVTTVDSGVAEIVRRQEAGWSYIKGGF